MQAPRRHVGFEFCDPLRGCAPDASGQFAYGKAEDAGAALVSEREIERLQHFRFESEPVILRIQAKELCVRPFQVHFKLFSLSNGQWPSESSRASDRVQPEAAYGHCPSTYTPACRATCLPDRTV